MASDKLYTYILLFFTSLLFGIFPSCQLPLLLLAWMIVVGYSLLRLKTRLLLFFFCITIFTFLLTRLVLPYIVMTDYIESKMDAIIYSFSPEINRHVYRSLFISIVSIFAGYSMVKETDEVHFGFDIESETIQKIRWVSKNLFIFCTFFFAIALMEKVKYVMENGYFSYYLDFKSGLPGIVGKLSNLYKPMLYLYLATMPCKKEARWLIYSFVLMAGFSLLTGGRSAFMLDCILVAVYYFLRNYLTPETPWISKKGMIAIIAALPILLIAMFMMASLRSNEESDSASLTDLFFNFFFQQGISVQVIGLTHIYQDILNDGRLFSLGVITDNFNDNFIFRLMGMGVRYAPQSEDMALYGHSLANTLTYYHEPEAFLIGYGLGTCYIAEIWHDFGYLGLVLWNILYGFILAKSYQWAQRNIWMFALSLIMIMHIIYAPRGCACTFLSESLLSPTLLIVFIFIYGVTHLAPHQFREEALGKEVTE